MSTAIGEQRPCGLITGASQGIGAAIASALAQTHDLYLGGRNGGVLASLARTLPCVATPWIADLADVDSLADSAPRPERLALLVHNAAATRPEPIDTTSAESWRHVFAVNVFAAVALTKLYLPALRATGGHVVFINAGSGLHNKAGRSAYAASKYALRAFADALAAEEAARGVRVTTIYPGPTDTELQRAAAESAGRPYHPDRLLHPESVADAVVHAVCAPVDATVTSVAVEPAVGR